MVNNNLEAVNQLHWGRCHVGQVLIFINVRLRTISPLRMDASEVQPRQGDKRVPQPGSRAERGKEDPGGELCLGLPRTSRTLSQWDLACSRMLRTTRNGKQVVLQDQVWTKRMNKTNPWSDTRSCDSTSTRYNIFVLENWTIINRQARGNTWPCHESKNLLGWEFFINLLLPC